MISAIVYTSNTGFTARYAKMLGEKTALPVYDLKGKDLPADGSQVLFLGWMMAGGVRGIDQAKKRWSVPCMCAVGMGSAEVDQEERLGNKHPDMKVFYLEGGYDHRRVHGIYKIMMNMVRSAMRKRPPSDVQSQRMLNAIQKGGDWVKEENLEPVLTWLKEQ